MCALGERLGITEAAGDTLRDFRAKSSLRNHRTLNNLGKAVSNFALGGGKIRKTGSSWATREVLVEL